MILSTNSPFTKFTYTLVGIEGEPQEKSFILNLNYVISIESTSNYELKITLINNKIILIDLGSDYKASTVMDEILDLSAIGADYNVYNISSIDK